MRLVLGFTLSLAIAACGSDDAPPARPNVVLISIDMLRPDHLSSYGYSRPTSPAIDRLASEGVLFENQISSSSWTLPAHAAMFTSVPDSVHQCTDTNTALSQGWTTLAERFASAGYSTAGFFAGPYLHPAFGLDQGFEHYENCTSYRETLDGDAIDRWAMDEGVMKASHRDVTNPTVYAAVEKWLAARPSDRPFFLFIHLWDVHFDFIPPPPYDTRFDPDYTGEITGENFFFDPRIHPKMAARDLEHLIALYDGEIAWTDSFIDKLRAAFESAGLLDGTVLAITSDHGTEFFEHGAKGHRQTLYDESIRVPLIVRYPPRIAAGKRVEAQTRCIDIGPTLLDLAGLPRASDVMGESLVPKVGAAGARDLRAVSELFSVGRNMRAVRTREWKWIDYIAAGKSSCYDLARDPAERSPLHGSGSAQCKSAELGSLEAVGVMKKFVGEHPVSTRESNVPEEIKRQLDSLGYTGGKDE